MKTRRKRFCNDRERAPSNERIVKRRKLGEFSLLPSKVPNQSSDFEKALGTLITISLSSWDDQGPSSVKQQVP